MAVSSEPELEPGDSGSGLFSPARRPVALPGDQLPSVGRSAASTVAIVTLVVGVISGLLYQQFWKTASHDVTRILPASTRTYARTAGAWETLSRAMQMDRWGRPGELRARAAAASLTPLEETGDVAGLPVESLRQLLTSADAVHLATVPTPAGPAYLSLFEFDDDRTRRRIRGRLLAHMETVDRQLGYAIYAVEQRDMMLPWRERVLPLRMVDMEPWLVFAYGPQSALTDLLQAKVSGTSQPIRTKNGFEALSGPGDGALTAYLSPGALHDALAGDESELPSELVELRRALVVEGVRALTARETVGEDDVLELTAHIGASMLWPPLTDLAGRRGHDLLSQAPAEADWLASVAITDPARSVAAVRRIVTRISEELGQPAELQRLEFRLLELELAAGLTLDEATMQALGGELVVMSLPQASGASDALSAGGDGLRWAAMLRVEDPSRVEQTADALIRFAFGDGYAFGTVVRDGRATHLVRRAVARSDGTPPHEVLAWRFRAGVLEIAPRRDVLEQLTWARLRRSTYGATGLARESLRAMPDDSAAVVLMHPRVLGTVGAAGELLASFLRDDFRIAASLWFEERQIHLRTNLGFWTLATALSTAHRGELDELLLGELSPRCREAVQALCAEAPRGLACRPWWPRRVAVAARACRRAGIVVDAVTPP